MALETPFCRPQNHTDPPFCFRTVALTLRLSSKKKERCSPCGAVLGPSQGPLGSPASGLSVPAPQKIEKGFSSAVRSRQTPPRQPQEGRASSVVHRQGRLGALRAVSDAGFALREAGPVEQLRLCHLGVRFTHKNTTRGRAPLLLGLALLLLSFLCLALGSRRAGSVGTPPPLRNNLSAVQLRLGRARSMAPSFLIGRLLSVLGDLAPLLATLATSASVSRSLLGCSACSPVLGLLQARVPVCCSRSRAATSVVIMGPLSHVNWLFFWVSLTV